MIELTVNDMTCGHCVKAVTQALKAVDPAAGVDIDLAAKRVRVETGQPRDIVTEALRQAGYPAT